MGEPVSLPPGWREALEQAGAHPATIAAMAKLGFLVHPGNLTSLSPAERRAWRQAVEGWFEEHGTDANGAVSG